MRKPKPHALLKIQMDHGFTECHKDTLSLSLPCSACNWLWPLPTTTSSNPKILLQSSTRLHYLLPTLCHLPPIFLHIYLPFYLDSGSPSELPPHPPHHHPQKLNLTSKLSHPTAHLQFNMNRLKIILVPVRNCPMFTCLGLKRVSEKQRSNFCYRSFGSSQKCVSQIFTLLLSEQGPTHAQEVRDKSCSLNFYLYLYSMSKMLFSSTVAPWVSVEASWS